MEIIIKDTYEQVSRTAAGVVAGTLHTKPNAVLGLATGSTPLGLYDELIRMHQDGTLDFAQVTNAVARANKISACRESDSAS